MAPISIHLGNVMADVKPISKDQFNKGQKFKFRGIDDVMKAVHPALVKHGVLVIPNVQERIGETRATSGGGTMNVVHLRVTFTFVGPEGDSLVASAWGEAQDSADKATNKAMSAALKMVLLQTLMIPTDEPDADAFHDEAAPLPPIDVDAALDQIRTADEVTCVLMILSLPEALAADRLTADGATRIEHAIETRRDYLEQERSE